MANRFSHAVLAAAASACLLPMSASAAVITGTAITPTGAGNLTAAGSTDWAYWTVPSNGGAAFIAPANYKSGGPRIIGNALPVTGTNVRGSTTLSQVGFAFTDGTSPISNTNQLVSGVFNLNLDTAGRGVQVSVSLPDTQLYKVSVWVSGYNAGGTLDAALIGASSYSDSSFSYVATKAPKLYELNVRADHASDTMTISYVMSTDAPGSGATNSHVVIAGVAVTAVPEPSLGLLAPLAILPLRRRRQSC